MSTAPIYFSRTVPARLVPDADALRVFASGLGPTGPIWTIQRGQYLAGTAEIAATPQQSGPGLPGYVPAQSAVPAVAEQFIVHREEVLTLTQSEWDNWDKSMSDVAYILGLAAARTGATLVSN